tara:strand:- start:1951 stop:3939 length:1989 start_codon:yes stop_codon:yes gene_type:complete
MAARLTPAYQTFNTANGSSPLAGGKIHFYVSGSVSTNKDTFSDSTLLTANTNPLVLDSAGRVQVDVWGDGAYKMVVADSTDTPIDTFDPVTGSFSAEAVNSIAELTALLKTILTDGDQFAVSGYTTQGDGGGGDFYWDASNTDTENGGTIFEADEGGTGRWLRIVEDSLTPKDFGSKPDGVTDNSVTLQAWVDYTYANKLLATDDGGHYQHASTIILATALQRWTFNGGGCGEKQNFINDVPAGTVFEYTGATGNGWEFGDGSTTNIQGFKLSNVAFWGTTTGTVLNVDRCQQFNVFEKIFVGQNGTGNGFIYADSWVGGIKDVYVKGPDNGTGIGFQLVQNDVQAGIINVENVTGDGFQYGVVFGDLTSGSGAGLRSVKGFVQGSNSDEGVVFGELVADSEFNVWTESNSVVGMRIFNQSQNLDIMSYHAEPTATEADIVIGLSGGTGLERTASRLRLSPSCPFTNNVAIQFYPAADSVDIIIDRPKLIPNVNGVGDGIAVGSGMNGLKIIQPTYGSGSNSFANNTTGTISASNEVETSGALGQLTRYAPQRNEGGLSVGVDLTFEDNKTLVANDTYAQNFNTGATNRTVTLPDNATNEGLRYKITKTDGGIGQVNISRVGSDTIVTGLAASGSLLALTQQFGSVVLISGGNGVWYQETLY